MADLIHIPQASTDGWTWDLDIWSYVSATSFKIQGKNVVARFPVGTKIKVTQTTAKYFYVVSSSFSTDTTVTVTGGSDYTIASAAITSPCYSYQSCPQGFPQWFNYDETQTGYSVDPTDGVCRFRVEGRTVFYNLARLTNGTSNANTNEASLPITAKALTGYYSGGWAIGVTTGPTTRSTDCRWYVTSGATVAKFALADSAIGWATSGDKNAIAMIIYEI